MRRPQRRGRVCADGMFHGVVLCMLLQCRVMSCEGLHRQRYQAEVHRDRMLHRDLYGRDIIHDAGICRRLRVICLALNAPFLMAS